MHLTPNKISTIQQTPLALMMSGTAIILAIAKLGKGKDGPFQVHATKTDDVDSTTSLLITDGITPIVLELGINSDTDQTIDAAEVEIRSWMIELPKKTSKVRKAPRALFEDIAFEFGRVYNLSGTTDVYLTLADLDDLGVGIASFLDAVEPDVLPIGHIAIDNAEDLFSTLFDHIEVDGDIVDKLSGKVVDITAGQQTDVQVGQSAGETVQKTGTDG